MTRYLFDTNVISEIADRPLGKVGRRVADCARESSCTSIIVVAELRFGLAKRPAPRRAETYAQILGELDILDFTEPADTAYGVIRAALERAGTPIGANDMLIAAQAVALGLTVVTDNEREFRRVAGLSVENWLRE